MGDSLNNADLNSYDRVLRSPIYREKLSQLANSIVSYSKTAVNEANVEYHFERELDSFFKEFFEPLGFKYNPTKEAPIKTPRHITKGRADSAIKSLIIEFKQPSTLKTKKSKTDAIEQIFEYMNNIDYDSVVGFVTDGVIGSFVFRKDAEKIIEPFYELDDKTMDLLIRRIISTRLVGLTSKNLAEHFCNAPYNDGIAFDLVHCLYNMLQNNAQPKTLMLFNEWKSLFNLSHEDKSKQSAIEDRKKSLESLMKISFKNIDDEYKAIFALQTGYAIIIKLIAYKIISDASYKSSKDYFSSLYDMDTTQMRMNLCSLEDGSIFRSYGVTNLLEGDFFSWYTNPKQWSDVLFTNIRVIVKELGSFSDRKVVNSAVKSQDFFKDLYYSMIPSAVRHSLGEYYTKRWLAKIVFEDALSMYSKKKWRGLDPCCGSGTFITVMIDRILEETKNLDTSSQLDNILDRVQGIDLNPVASLTARINYFVNISHLWNMDRPVEIPIYLGDSSYIPNFVTYDSIECIEYTINTLKDPINILLPRSIIEDPARFSHAMVEVESAIRRLDPEGVFNILLSLTQEPERTAGIKKKIMELSHQLVELERMEWNGIWARIITNYLTIANIGSFDIIIGNPPWVDWRNLPSVYRDRLKGLCLSRELFSGDRITGGINLNICALITSVSAEKWLSHEGILAFLMPEPLLFQSTFRGFRNLYKSDGTRFYFAKFTNWTKAGYPFYPVTQPFYTYYISNKKMDYSEGVPTEWYISNQTINVKDMENVNPDKAFTRKQSLMITCHNDNFFTNVDDISSAKYYEMIAQDSEYISRQGIEFYPEELWWFNVDHDLPPFSGSIPLINVQNHKSKYHIPQKRVLLESKFLHPLIRSTDIIPFHVNISGLIVPYPYSKDNPKMPFRLMNCLKSRHIYPIILYQIRI